MFLYSSKLIQKEPRTGGAFQWHQDYGYRYMSGNMTPDMSTEFIAMDPCDKGNVCLELCIKIKIYCNMCISHKNII